MAKYDQFIIKSLAKDDSFAMPGTWPSFIFGKESFPQAPYHVEITTIDADCTMMEGTDKGAEKIVWEDPDYVYGYNGPYPWYSMEADRYILFFGSNDKDLRDLGAHVVFHLGDDVRDEEETFEFEEPRCVYIPKGVRFGPIKISGLKRNVVMVDILAAPSLKEGKVIVDFTYYSEYHDQLKLKNRQMK